MRSNRDRGNTPGEGPSPDETLGTAGDFHRQSAFVALEITDVVSKLRTEMARREDFVAAAICERTALPTIHIECSCDGDGELFEGRLTRGAAIVRGEALLAVERRIAEAYALADKEQLGLPPDAATREFVEAINREMLRNPMRGVFFMRALSGIEENGVAYSDLAKLGRFQDSRGEYRVERKPEAAEVELGQSFGSAGELGALTVSGDLEPGKRYHFDTVSHAVTFNRCLEDGERWSDFEPLTPSPAEAQRILVDLNEVYLALAHTLEGIRPKRT
ncbi:MAG: hypothetical protein RL417_2259 [Pseudomonadota bacterium]